MLVQVCVQSLGLDRSSNLPVVILQESEGERILPIWIGPGEASAIAMELADMKFDSKTIKAQDLKGLSETGLHVNISQT